MDMIIQQQYIEHIKKQFTIVETNLINKIEDKLETKIKQNNINIDLSKIKKNINIHLITDIKKINEGSDKDAKQILQNKSIQYELEHLNDDDMLLITDSAYHIYSIKRRAGLGRIMSFLMSHIFILQNFIQFCMVGEIVKKDLEKNIEEITNKPILSYIKGILTWLFVRGIVFILYPLTKASDNSEDPKNDNLRYIAMISFFSIYMGVLQSIRFLALVIKKNPFTYKINPLAENNINQTYMLYKKMKLI